MAKKRKAKKTTTRRRRSSVGTVRASGRRRSRKISGVDSTTNALMLLGSAAVGFVVGSAASKYTPVGTPLIKGIGKGVLGVGIVVIKKGKIDATSMFGVGFGLSGVVDVGKEVVPAFMGSIGATDDRILYLNGPDGIGDGDSAFSSPDGIGSTGGAYDGM